MSSIVVCIVALRRRHAVAPRHQSATDRPEMIGRPTRLASERASGHQLRPDHLCDYSSRAVRPQTNVSVTAGRAVCWPAWRTAPAAATASAAAAAEAVASATAMPGEWRSGQVYA